MYQYLDPVCLGVGGDRQQRFALYLGDSFYRGSSNPAECYGNEVLSGSSDFLCLELEVWGLS
jgi:hypothetical protein